MFFIWNQFHLSPTSKLSLLYTTAPVLNFGQCGLYNSGTAALFMTQNIFDTCIYSMRMDLAPNNFYNIGFIHIITRQIHLLEDKDIYPLKDNRKAWVVPLWSWVEPISLKLSDFIALSLQYSSWNFIFDVNRILEQISYYRKCIHQQTVTCHIRFT